MGMDVRQFLNNQETYKYQDMIHLPHHVSRTHAHMPVKDRDAQFAPFAALTGHYEAVKETQRLTEERIELDEYCKASLERKLKEIREQSVTEPAVSVTYFIPDARKAGGAYVTAEGRVKKIDEYERVLVFTDGRRVMVDEIIEIDEGADYE